MSNFVNFLKSEHILKLGVSFMIGYSTQNFFQSIIEKFVKRDDFKTKDPLLVNFLTLIFVLVFSYFLSKVDIR